MQRRKNFRRLRLGAEGQDPPHEPSSCYIMAPLGGWGAPGRAAVGSGTRPGGLPGLGSAGCPPGERGRAAVGRRRQVRGAGGGWGAASRARCLPASLSPSLLPLPPPASTSKSAHERGFPGRCAAQWRLGGAAAFIAVRQTGRNSHFPPGCSPARRRPAWRTL